MTELGPSRSVSTARCPFGGGLNAVVRAHAGEWPVSNHSGPTFPLPASRLLAMLEHLRLGRLGRHSSPRPKFGVLVALPFPA
jgi:hypothetical protein